MKTGSRKRQCLVSSSPQWKIKSPLTSTPLPNMDRSLIFTWIDSQKTRTLVRLPFLLMSKFWKYMSFGILVIEPFIRVIVNIQVFDPGVSWYLIQVYHEVNLWSRCMGWLRVRPDTGTASTLPRLKLCHHPIKSSSPSEHQVLLSVVNKVDVRARHKIHQSRYFNSEVLIWQWWWWQ